MKAILFFSFFFLIMLINFYSLLSSPKESEKESRLPRNQTQNVTNMLKLML